MSASAAMQTSFSYTSYQKLSFDRGSNSLAEESLSSGFAKGGQRLLPAPFSFR